MIMLSPRQSLFGALAIAAVAFAPALRAEPQPKLAREIFKELIEINTVFKNGSSEAAEAMAARLKAAGFPASDVQLLGPDPHKNLVVRFHGNGGAQKPLLFICHLDVVEALREDWSFEPFVFLEKDGYFYGRGTTDIKCEDAALMTALIRLRQEGFVPARDIIVALTANEEGGVPNGVELLLRNHRALIDAEYCINPDGGGGEIKQGKHVVMELQTSEKTYLAYQLDVTNKGGHGSLPRKDNAIFQLTAALNRLAAFEFPLHLNETTRTYFERNASIETGPTKADMLALLQPTPDRAAADRLAAASPFYNAMMRTTAVATLLSGGHAQNALPQKAQAVLNARMLPGETIDEVTATLVKVVADDQIKVSLISNGLPAPLSPLRADLMTRVEKLTSEMWPGVIVTPTMSTGATDAVHLRSAGIPVYGISGMFGDVEDVRAHGKDERIGVKEFDEGVEFTYRLMKAVAQ